MFLLPRTWYRALAAALILPALPALALPQESPGDNLAPTAHLERARRALDRGRWTWARRHLRWALEAGGDARQARAREMLLELNRASLYPRWLTATSEHFVLHTPRGSPVAGDPENFLARREEAYARITDTLQTAPDGPIHLFVYSSGRQGEQLLGRPLAFADPGLREIHMRHDQEPGHEEAHVIAWTWNRSGAGVPFLEEGLAVALSGHPGSATATAAEDLARDVLPDLADLIHRFREHRNGYALAGSFVEQLLDLHGPGTVRRLYTGTGPFAARLEAATGQSLGQLQSAWETLLAAQGTASREPLQAALSLLWLDRVDEAVAQLEEARDAAPDNPLVLYALAHARQAQGDARGTATALRALLRLPLPFRLAWMEGRARQTLDALEPAP